MTLKKHKVILLILLTSSIAFSQVKFEAKVSKNIVHINETIIIDFEINMEEDENTFTPPNFSGFAILNNRNIKGNSTSSNGQSEFKKTYKVFISPKKEGAFVIDEATIKVDGKLYKTNPIKIKVIADNDKREQEYVNKEFNSNVFLVSEASNLTPQLNETFTVTYKLYVSSNFGISKWKLLETPVFEKFNFNTIDIGELKIENEIFKGENYRYVILKKIELKGKETGEFKISPLKLNVIAEIPVDRRDLFGSRIVKTIERRIESNWLTVTVK